MKKIVILLSTALLALTSCKEDGEINDNNNFIEPVNYTVQVQTEEAFKGIPLEDIQIELSNKETQKKYKVATDKNGKVTVKVTPGVYNIQASIIISEDKMEEVTSQKQKKSFTAIKENVTINKDKNNCSLILKAGRVGNLIIKQLYYSGSGYSNGASSRDQFFEIYNNSNESLYLDGLCFAQISGLSKSKTGEKYLDNGHFDWSKAPGLESLGDKANTDYVYADEIIAFPGTGKQYAIEAGKSVLVAASAINHKSPLTVTKSDGTSKTYTVKNPDLTIDLSNAKFEVYFGNYAGVPKKDAKDIDSPNATDMEILYKSNGAKEFAMKNTGDDAFVIFRSDKVTIDTWKKAISPVSYIKECIQIPNNIVIDAVELNNIKKLKPKRLSSSLDGGFVSPLKGSGKSESAIRKVAKTIDGRIIYQDTNNSSNDFEIIERPDTSSLN